MKILSNLVISGSNEIQNIPAASIDTDKFIVSDSGVIKYRTGSQVLSDIGAQVPITLTTIGTSGVATFDGTTLNIPQYTGGGGSGATVRYTQTYTCTAGQTLFTITHGLYAGYFDVYLNGLKLDPASYTYTTLSLTLVDPAALNDILEIVVYDILSMSVVAYVPDQSGNSGKFLQTDGSALSWASAQLPITLTTTGSSGAATFISDTLNIPTYTLSGLGGEPAITAGTTSQYWRGDKTWQTLNTTAVTEGTNLYFTEARVIGTVLTGLNLTGGGTISATDTILQAFGKVQNQISALVGGVMYQGVWNANTNSPSITSSVGVKGNYYVVSVAGSTNIDGITDWKIGDWIIYNGTTWDKVDNTDAVSSVNGFTGAVSLTTTNISEGTNLYYTDTRARAAISLTTTGNSGAATYTSGVLNIPNYTLSGLGGQPLNTNLTSLSGLTYVSASFLKMTAAGTFTLDTNTYYLASNPSSYITLTSLSSTATGLTYTNTTGVFSLTSGYVIPTTTSTSNWDTAYTNRITSLTTTGSSGSATLISNTLNIPTYTLSGLGGQPLNTNLTSLSGLTYVSGSFVKMTASGTFTLDTNSYYLDSNPNGYTSNTGTVTSVSVSTANGFAGTVSTSTTTPAITISTTVTGLLKGNGTAISAAVAGTDYLVSNQTITLSGDVSGSGSTAITTTIGNAAVTYAKIQNVAANTFLANATGSAASVQEISTTRIPLFATAITGTPSSSTYLRGDGSWATITSGGITSLNTLTASTQTFATGTNGTDFNISSNTSTHTFNIPDASESARGVITTGTQTFAGNKMFSFAISTATDGNNYNGNLYASAVGHSNIGLSQFVLAGGSGTSFRVSMTGASTFANSSPASDYSNVIIGSTTASKAGSGSHNLYSQLAIKALVVGTGSATVTNTATLYVESAATGGTNNYAVWVDDGTVRLDGAFELQGITSSTTSNVLYYDTTTKRVSYGTAATGSGTVTDVSVVSANGFAGTVATSTTTPAITISTTITGLLKGNGTAISAAVAGTDYLTSAITTLGTSGNGQTGASQVLATGTTGTDFNISSSTNTHTFNIPDAGSSSRGLITTGSQNIAGTKSFLGSTSFSNNLFNASSSSAISTSSAYLTGSFTQVTYRNAFNNSASALTLSNNSTAYQASNLFLQQNTTAPTTGSFGLVANVVIKGSAITASTGTVTNAAALVIDGASTGATNNYSLWVNGGTVRLDGAFELQGIASSTTANTLYYDATTKRVTYGAAPGGGPSAYTVTSQTTTYTATATSGTLIIKCDTTGGAFTVNLPTAVGNTATIIIKKTAGSGAVTVDGNASETVDGGLTATINKVYESITLISDNSNWQIV